MKKWLIGFGTFGAVIVAVPAVGLVLNSIDYQTPVRHVRNDKLPLIKPDWPGNTLDQKDRFMDERDPFLPNTMDLLKWRMGRNPFKDEKEKDVWRPAVKDPVEFLSSEADGIMWLGHATFYIRLGGKGILTDPVFDEPFPLKRLVQISSPLDKINNVDYVLLSHDHRDHMDEASLRAIAAKFPSAVFLAGLRSEDVLDEWKTRDNPVMTAGWFQAFDLPKPVIDEQLDVYFHPVRHWSRRWLFDINWRLWGSFVIKRGETTIYFGGDSGYAPHYREAGELFPDIDYFLVGIGAYEPRWFMRPNHNTPAEAVAAFQDARAAVLIPMHYATFDLSDEPPGQPLRFLFDEAARAGVSDRVRPLAINEALVID